MTCYEMYSVYFYVETIKKLHALRQSWILDWIPRRGFPIQGTGFQFLSVELGPCIPIFSGISDSLSCIPDSKAQDSGVHKQKFPRFRNLGPYMEPLHGATSEYLSL